MLASTSLGGNNATKEMLLAQQQASAQWAFYQAKVIREPRYRVWALRVEADLFERGRARRPEVRVRRGELAKKFADEEKRYNAEKKGIVSVLLALAGALLGLNGDLFLGQLLRRRPLLASQP